jgi:hypothetical protein
MSYTEIANATRAAAYSEAPVEDLVAELAKMKAMMEQMRQDKERLEMEAKRRAEEDAAALRAKQEVEAAVKLQKEKKELDAIFQQFQNYVVRTPNLRFENPSAYTFGRNEKQLLTMIENSGETILSVGFSTHVRYGNPDDQTIPPASGQSDIHWNVQSRGISLILTNCQLYGVYYNFDKAEYCENKFNSKMLIKMNHTMSFQCVSLYQFSEPLNIKYATMLLYILKTPNYYGSQPISLWSYATLVEPTAIDTTSSNTILKRFESVIRLIPGSYKNGDWRQLDGFFGMYFNETTMELSEVPPPSL